MPKITWLKDGTPVSKRITAINAEGTSQLLIPSSERSDTGIYTIILKNIVGQETFSIEIRVTGNTTRTTEYSQKCPFLLFCNCTPMKKHCIHLH